MRYLLNIHLTMCDKLENRCDLTFKMLVKKLKYIDVFFTLGIVHQHSKRGGGRREREREHRSVMGPHEHRSVMGPLPEGQSKLEGAH